MNLSICLEVSNVQAIPLGSNPILMPYRFVGRIMPRGARRVGGPFPIASSDATRQPPHQPVGYPKHHACCQRNKVSKPGLI